MLTPPIDGLEVTDTVTLLASVTNTPTDIARVDFLRRRHEPSRLDHECSLSALEELQRL